jgi:two-component system sensor histidine kinase/response regulator
MTQPREDATAKLLLVDDRPENLLALEAALRPLGQQLVTAGSGEEALRWLLTDDFAVILLDVQMPGMDGFETAAQIKQRERSRTIPIIFLTAISRELHQQLRGYEVGAVDYISKPYDPWVLRSKVSVFVNLYIKTRLLEEQTAQLAQANNELEQFAEMLSHDLRSPLLAVTGYLELLETFDGEGKDFAHRALDAARSMGNLIDDLLSYARAGQAVGLLRSTDAGKALEQALANCQRDIEESGTVVTRGELPVVPADGPQLTRLFQNLIENSVKYRRPDRPLEVRVEAERSGQEWVFSVTDNGLGIPHDDPAHDLFAMFQRGRAAAAQPGSGIGLAICKKIAEGHGGRIWAEPEHRGGAVFRFTIPAPASH